MSARLLPATRPSSRPTLVIGSRWTPKFRESIDRESGTYECVNSLMDGSIELTTQAALLLPVPPRVLQLMAEVQRLRKQP